MMLDMAYRRRNRNRRELITELVLVALAFRALIPAGFMPATAAVQRKVAAPFATLPDQPGK